MELTKKQKEFADEYLETGNGTQAALKAYDASNENSAAVEANRTLRKAKIQKYLEDKAEKAALRVEELSNQKGLFVLSHQQKRICLNLRQRKCQNQLFFSLLHLVNLN